MLPPGASIKIWPYQLSLLPTIKVLSIFMTDPGGIGKSGTCVKPVLDEFAVPKVPSPTDCGSFGASFIWVHALAATIKPKRKSKILRFLNELVST